ncbi:MAG: pilus (MSHA type) biogenesis protein MshL [Deltaproteobacteria bacterium]|nr:pilus (MSHA type) biogenesis protein MshL [Deltaproteobacteria bacterium]
MKTITRLLLCLIFILAGGCSIGPASVYDPVQQSPESIPKQIISESDEMAEMQKGIVKNLEKKRPRKFHLEPILPVYDPLEDHIVSFSMIDEDLKFLLYSLARSTGMNLVMPPVLEDKKRLITVNFDKVSAATVMKEVLKSYDLYYEVDRNVIRVKPYKEKFFNLNFLDTNVNMNFDVGGDVLGAGETESASGLSGNFKLSGTAAIKGNAYDLIEQMIGRMISRGGKYSLNRLSGSLYVKDSPASVYAIAELINHLKEMLTRQILIDARIIEVTLSDKYSYGIDWSILRREMTGVTKLNNLSWGLEQGLVISGVSKAFSGESAIDALRTFGDAKIISNPRIRSKNGKPAIISVGTSYTYKKSVTTKKTTSTSETEESTDVDVSTVFDGLILGIIPFIEEDGHVTLLINPIKSDVDPESIEPVPVTANAGDSISLPVVHIKEISSTIGLYSGDTVFLGGLFSKHHQTIKKGVPFLSGIPLLGYLFKNESMREETRELVMILNVSVI